MRLPQRILRELGSHLRRIVMCIEQFVEEARDRAGLKTAFSVDCGRGRSLGLIGLARVERVAHDADRSLGEQRRAPSDGSDDVLPECLSKLDGRLMYGVAEMAHWMPGLSFRPQPGLPRPRWMMTRIAHAVVGPQRTLSHTTVRNGRPAIATAPHVARRTRAPIRVRRVAAVDEGEG